MEINKNVALFGGSFDPVHCGHLAIAKAAVEQFSLSRVYFIPANQAPLKHFVPGASAEQRLEMLRLATGDEPLFEVLDWEISAGGTSYSVNTAERFCQTYQCARVYWLLGQDQVKQLPQWYAIERLAEIVDFLAYRRSPQKSAGLEGKVQVDSRMRLHWLKGPCFDISSTGLRDEIASGCSPVEGLPEAVETFVRQNRIYCQR